jgi:YqaJ-like viral recombinase domain
MIQIHDVEQGTPAWYLARLGLPTASNFATIMAKGKDGGPSVTRTTYLRKLAGEILTGEPAESYSNTAMERGKEMEPEARSFYSLLTDADPQLVGFITNGPKGCSPDALIGADGVLEIKRAQPNVLIEALLRDGFPPEHKAQCQGALWVAEREWVDICVYWPKMPVLIRRAYRDEAYIAGLETAVGAFNAELTELVARLRRYGAGATERAA